MGSELPYSLSSTPHPAPQHQQMASSALQMAEVLHLCQSLWGSTDLDTSLSFMFSHKELCGYIQFVLLDTDVWHAFPSCTPSAGTRRSKAQVKHLHNYYFANTDQCAKHLISLYSPVIKFQYQQSHYWEDNPPNSLYYDYFSIIYLLIILFLSYLTLNETKDKTSKSLTLSWDLACT